MRLHRTLGVATAVLLFLARPAPAQETLRFKFKEGEKLQYVFEMDMKLTMTVMGMDTDVRMKMGGDLAWEVAKVNPQGSASVRLRFTRMKIALEAADKALAFDSDAKNAQEPDDPAEKAIAQVMNGIVGLEVTCTMTPTGEVTDAVIPKEALKKLKDIPGSDKFAEDFLTPDGIKKFAQGGVLLPTEPVSKGKSWTQKQSTKIPFGKMTGEMKFVYDGPVEKGGKRLEKITLRPDFKLELGPDAPAQIKLKSTVGKGALLFDNRAGRMVEQSADLGMEIEVEADGMTITQRMSMGFTLRLKNRARPGGR